MTSEGMSGTFNVAVVGGGPAGLAAAIAAAASGASTALIARDVPYADNRTTALLGGSVEWLAGQGIWQRCEKDAAPLKVMRLVDDTGRLLRAPEARFDCHEIGLDAFGYNIENRYLVAAMEARAAELPGLSRFNDVAVEISSGQDHVTIVMSGGASVTAKLVVGADGRQGLSRAAAGIVIDHRSLPQTALTFNIRHSRPHLNVSTEFHTKDGPCVLVPLRGDRSSVVWVTTPARAEQLNALGDADLAEAIERQSHSILGRVELQPGRALFPLAIDRPRRIADNRIALVGEAAHVFPPIGAQGLNLGLRDAAAIGTVVAAARERHEDVGGIQALQDYDRSRRVDIASRSVAIDLANRALLSDFLPAQAVRAAGLQAIRSLGPLRRLVMRAGLSGAVHS